MAVKSSKEFPLYREYSLLCSCCADQIVHKPLVQHPQACSRLVCKCGWFAFYLLTVSICFSYLEVYPCGEGATLIQKQRCEDCGARGGGGDTKRMRQEVSGKRGQEQKLQEGGKDSRKQKEHDPWSHGQNTFQ